MMDRVKGNKEGRRKEGEREGGIKRIDGRRKKGMEEEIGARGRLEGSMEEKKRGRRKEKKREKKKMK